ncbi:MAG: ABC transporter ATP-binding protein [Planctomycetota bacterium]|nr:MAG: ABC transporter ATP-binding protein [Planctomycetota bacterium]
MSIVRDSEAGWGDWKQDRMERIDRHTAGAAAVLEHFTANDPVLERDAPRRILVEVQHTWQGDARQYWWRWFSEAADSLGLRTKTVDCTLEEAFNLARDGAQIVLYRDRGPDDGEWLAVLAASKRRFRVLVARDHAVVKTVSPRKLNRLISRFEEGDQVRALVIVPNDAEMSSAYTLDGHRLTPFERLWTLLAPESSDLWLVVVFAFVVALLALATPMAVETLVNTVAFGRFLQPIIVLALILFLFLGVQAAIRALQMYVVEILQRKLFARIAGDLAFRMPRTSLEKMEGSFPPELVNRFLDVATAQKIIGQLMLDGIDLLLSAGIGMLVLAFYHPWLLGFDFFLIISVALVVFVLGRGAVKTAIKESGQKYRMAAWLEDVARCPTTFRNDGGPDLALERADRLVHNYLEMRRRHFRILMRQVLFAAGLQAVASTVLLGLGGWLVVSGQLTLGQLVAAELIVSVIVGSVAKLGKHLEGFYDLLAAVDKLGVLFDLPMERQYGMLAIDTSEPATVGAHNISFAWPNQRPLFSDLNIQLDGGESLAIRGPAGSGKSILMDLLYGLRAPTTGFATIDGFNPRDLRPDVLRGRVALVRGVEVFHGPVDENVHLHRPNITANDVRDTLEALGVLDAVLRLESGFDTVLQSDGRPLSTTQCQMLCLARATTGSPGLLLIDGMLDSLGDQHLEGCLNYLLSSDRPWTLVVATARDDIAARCSQTISLRQG